MEGKVLLTIAACCLAVASASTIPPEKVCICPMDYNPVCGIDGITYGNKCELECAEVELSSDGECPKPCLCNRVYRPVCGQDGKTYSNECMLNCSGVALFQNGLCNGEQPRIEKRQAVCICTFLYDPVCGSDGVTYGNSCNLECEEGITQLHEGPCDGTENETNTTTMK